MEDYIGRVFNIIKHTAENKGHSLPNSIVSLHKRLDTDKGLIGKVNAAVGHLQQKWSMINLEMVRLAVVLYAQRNESHSKVGRSPGKYYRYHLETHA